MQECDEFASETVLKFKARILDQSFERAAVLPPEAEDGGESGSESGEEESDAESADMRVRTDPTMAARVQALLDGIHASVHA